MVAVESDAADLKPEASLVAVVARSEELRLKCEERRARVVSWCLSLLAAAVVLAAVTPAHEEGQSRTIRLSADKLLQNESNQTLDITSDLRGVTNAELRLFDSVSFSHGLHRRIKMPLAEVQRTAEKLELTCSGGFQLRLWTGFDIIEIRDSSASSWQQLSDSASNMTLLSTSPEDRVPVTSEDLAPEPALETLLRPPVGRRTKGFSGSRSRSYSNSNSRSRSGNVWVPARAPLVPVAGAAAVVAAVSVGSRRRQGNWSNADPDDACSLSKELERNVRRRASRWVKTEIDLGMDPISDLSMGVDDVCVKIMAREHIGGKPVAEGDLVPVHGGFGFVRNLQTTPNSSHAGFGLVVHLTSSSTSYTTSPMPSRFPGNAESALRVLAATEPGKREEEWIETPSLSPLRGIERLPTSWFSAGIAEPFMEVNQSTECPQGFHDVTERSMCQAAIYFQKWDGSCRYRNKSLTVMRESGKPADQIILYRRLCMVACQDTQILMYQGAWRCLVPSVSMSWWQAGGFYPGKEVSGPNFLHGNVVGPSSMGGKVSVRPDWTISNTVEYPHEELKSRFAMSFAPGDVVLVLDTFTERHQEQVGDTFGEQVYTIEAGTLGVVMAPASPSVLREAGFKFLPGAEWGESKPLGAIAFVFSKFIPSHPFFPGNNYKSSATNWVSPILVMDTHYFKLLKVGTTCVYGHQAINQSPHCSRPYLEACSQCDKCQNFQCSQGLAGCERFLESIYDKCKDPNFVAPSQESDSELSGGFIFLFVFVFCAFGCCVQAMPVKDGLFSTPQMVLDHNKYKAERMAAEGSSPMQLQLSFEGCYTEEGETHSTSYNMTLLRSGDVYGQTSDENGQGTIQGKVSWWDLNSSGSICWQEQRTGYDIEMQGKILQFNGTYSIHAQYVESGPEGFVRGSVDMQAEGPRTGGQEIEMTAAPAAPTMMAYSADCDG